MAKVNHINSEYLGFLTPLIDWRILDVKSLKDALGHNNSYVNFCRAIRLLEEKNIIKSYKDPFTRKKYLYLTEKAEINLAVDKNNLLSNETLIHDLKVTELSRQFLESGHVNEVKLEHELKENNKSYDKYRIIPDAVYTGTRNGIKFRMAFELELSRKSNERFLDKLESYLVSSFYDYVLYVLPSEAIVQKYYQKFSENFGEKFINKIMFFGSKDITINSIDINKIQGKFKNRDLTIRDLFLNLHWYFFNPQRNPSY